MLPDDAGVVFVFFCTGTMAEGALIPPLFMPHHPIVMGGCEGQEPQLWSLHLHVFWHFWCPPAGGGGGAVCGDSEGVHH